jgi:hypothetical protein
LEVRNEFGGQKTEIEKEKKIKEEERKKVGKEKKKKKKEIMPGVV